MVKTKDNIKFEPSLRFPEFEGEWIYKKVKGIAPLQRGFDLPVIDIKQGIYPVVFSNGILKTHNQFKAKGPGVVTGRSGTIGKVSFVEDDYWPHNTSLWVTSFEGNIPRFIYYFYVNFKLERLGTGSGVPTLNRNDVHDQKRHIPTPPEQEKIASFLSAVDNKIQHLMAKKQLLKQYKKGVMQRIFSQEIRFTDDNGKNYPDWEEKKLGDVTERVTVKNKNSKVVFVLTNSATEGVVSQKDYFDREIANQNNLEGYYIVSKGDFVYNPRISSSAPVGPIKRNKLQEGIMSPLYTVFRFKVENLEYFEYFFETTMWHKYMHSVANFGARHDRMNITNADFLKMPIPFPCNDERERISLFLRDLTKKLDSTKASLIQTQTFKKGLLQQLFV